MKLILLVVCVFVLPGIIVGIVRKTKARFQNRIGAPLWQPIKDIVKLLRKDETLSDTASWVFRFSAALNVAIVLYLACISPWIAPHFYNGPCDLFLFLYILAASRLFTLFAAMDTASAFGAFASSREATLAFLVEPAAVLSLVSLAVAAHSSDLNVVFSFANSGNISLWLLSGTGFLLASIVELSRMPIDDPTTHLELTMVHEALILEGSGKNLALFEFSHAVKLTMLWGLCAQCYLHVMAARSTTAMNEVYLAIASIILICLIALAVGMFESVAVKLNWRKAPEFIAYALTLSFMASMIASGTNPI